MPHSWVYIKQCFGGMCCLRLQGRRLNPEDKLNVDV